jgi:hypothetical protein
MDLVEGIDVNPILENMLQKNSRNFVFRKFLKVCVFLKIMRVLENFGFSKILSVLEKIWVLETFGKYRESRKDFQKLGFSKMYYVLEILQFFRESNTSNF